MRGVASLAVAGVLKLVLTVTNAWFVMLLLPAATSGRLTPGFGQALGGMIVVWIVWPPKLFGEIDDLVSGDAR